ncbi:MAG: DNA repair protein RadC [Verrucomicrobiales bacterium]
MRSSSLKEVPEDQLPRERMMELGPQALSNAELLAILLRVGSSGQNVLELSAELLKDYDGRLSSLARIQPQELCQRRGIKAAKATILLAAFELAGRVAREHLRNLPMDRPERVYDYLGPEMSCLTKEELRVLIVNAKYQLTRSVSISRGTINETVAHPRDVFAPVMTHSGYGFVLVHNHPSGDPRPSQADRRLTSRLSEGAGLLELVFLDHIIIGQPGEDHPGYFSFREAGLLS